MGTHPSPIPVDRAAQRLRATVKPYFHCWLLIVCKAEPETLRMPYLALHRRIETQDFPLGTPWSKRWAADTQLCEWPFWIPVVSIERKYLTCISLVVRESKLCLFLCGYLQKITMQGSSQTQHMCACPPNIYAHNKL